MENIDFSGLIPIVGGVYGLLLEFRLIPKDPKDPERLELWHRKFGTLMKLISPPLIGFGILTLFRVI